MEVQVQHWQRSSIIIPTAIALASLAVLGYRITEPVWLENLKIWLKSRKLAVPISIDIDRWRCKGIDVNDDDILCEEVKSNNSWWDTLESTFHNRGYTLYVICDPRDNRSFGPSPVDGYQHSKQEYPYARRLYEKNSDADLEWAPCIRGARDREGRDVVIRITSTKAHQTKELEILRYLRSPALQQDPRNITIPILCEQEIYSLIFIVMPRWDCAWDHDFNTATELLDAAEIHLKYLEFLHEHRIAHMDLHEGNTAVNTIIRRGDFFAKGLRHPDVTRYAVFDFGESYIYPRHTPLDEPQEVWDKVGWGMRKFIKPNVPFNPFKADVGAMGRILEGRVRVLEETIPELVPFFESMQEFDASLRPTAREALCQFQHIRANLTPEQLAAPVRAYFWHPVRGMTFKKEYKQPKKR